MAATLMVEWIALGVSFGALVVGIWAHHRAHKLELARDEERRAAEKVVRLVPTIVRLGKTYALRIENRGPGAASAVRVLWNGEQIVGNQRFMNPPEAISALAAGAHYDIRVLPDMGMTPADLRPNVTMYFQDLEGNESVVESTVSF